MARIVKDVRHGVTGYRTYGCRCETCTDANRDRQWHDTLRRRERLEAGTGEPAVHNASAYTNWGCRCQVCTEAHAAMCADQARRRAERAAAGAR
jgi:hypothetical protein